MYEYSKCSTCKKAKQYLKENNIDAQFIEIKEQTPTKEELLKIVDEYNIDIKKLFNTSGMKYRELGLKDKLSTLTKEEKIDLLISDGMLIKRPLVIDIKNNKVLLGFKVKEWDTLK